MRAAPGRRRGNDTGASAIELAFLAPVLLMFIFFAIQTGLWWYGRTVAIQAAREGVSELRLAPDRADYDANVSAIVDRTQRFAVEVGRESLLDPKATPAYDEAGGRVSMTVTGSVITLWPGPKLTVTQTAHGEVERFEGDR
jgi:Flp pilus assembly protein TadG